MSIAHMVSSAGRRSPFEFASSSNSTFSKYNMDVLPRCVYNPSTGCRDTRVLAAVGSAGATIFVRVAVGTVLERTGPVNTQIVLMPFGAFWVPGSEVSSAGRRSPLIARAVPIHRFPSTNMDVLPRCGYNPSTGCRDTLVHAAGGSAVRPSSCG